MKADADTEMKEAAKRAEKQDENNLKLQNQCMAHEHTWKKLLDRWNEPEGPHPRPQKEHQLNDEKEKGPKYRSSKETMCADHPFYPKHRPDNADSEEWMMHTIYEAELDYSEDEESATVTQDNVNDIQVRHNMHHTEDDNAEPTMTLAAKFEGFAQMTPH